MSGILFKSGSFTNVKFGRGWFCCLGSQVHDHQMPRCWDWFDESGGKSRKYCIQITWSQSGPWEIKEAPLSSFHNTYSSTTIRYYTLFDAHSVLLQLLSLRQPHEEFDALRKAEISQEEPNTVRRCVHRSVGAGSCDAYFGSSGPGKLPPRFVQQKPRFWASNMQTFGPKIC